MYPAKPQRFPDCSIIRASLENVEKVVNPPQSPTVRNKAQLLPSLAVRLNRPHKNPIRKQPTRFTDSVAQGNPLPMPFISSDTRYLAAPPMKLPAPTTAIFLMMSDTIEFRFIEAPPRKFNFDKLVSAASRLPAGSRLAMKPLSVIDFSCFRIADMTTAGWRRGNYKMASSVPYSLMAVSKSFAPPVSPNNFRSRRTRVLVTAWGVAMIRLAISEGRK